MSNYRNKKLLEAARDCPNCMACERANDDTIVAAHSNQIRDGKGTGIKAHDYRIAFLCCHCHYFIDSSSGGTRKDRHEVWEEAHRRTIGYLIENGILS